MLACCFIYLHTLCMSAAKALSSLHICACSSEIFFAWQCDIVINRCVKNKRCSPELFFSPRFKSQHVFQKSIRGIVCDVYENTLPFNFGTDVSQPALYQLYFMTVGKPFLLFYLLTNLQSAKY